MKYIKTYESINEPKTGDYVICRDEAYQKHSDINIYLSETIGHLVEINNYKTDYIVRYDNIPKILSRYFSDSVNGYKILYMRRHEIIQFSSNEGELDAMIAAKKYNI